MRNFCLTALVFLLSQVLFSQTIEGKWKTIDDVSGEAKSIVEIVETNGIYTGTVLSLFRKPGEIQDPLCDACSGEKHNQRITGMQIIEGLSKNDDVWEGGSILDPENGKTYTCRLWLEEGNLKMRGYIGFFFRTQTWYPAE